LRAFWWWESVPLKLLQTLTSILLNYTMKMSHCGSILVLRCRENGAFFRSDCHIFNPLLSFSQTLFRNHFRNIYYIFSRKWITLSPRFFLKLFRNTRMHFAVWTTQTLCFRISFLLFWVFNVEFYTESKIKDYFNIIRSIGLTLMYIGLSTTYLNWERMLSRPSKNLHLNKSENTKHFGLLVFSVYQTKLPIHYPSTNYFAILFL